MLTIQFLLKELLLVEFRRVKFMRRERQFDTQVTTVARDFDWPGGAPIVKFCPTCTSFDVQATELPHGPAG